jgi:hypothetical protein
MGARRGYAPRDIDRCFHAILYEHSPPALMSVVGATQVTALVLLVITLRRNPDQQALLS